MALGPYSPCPGGLDKKIKFCCADLLGEWQKIDRMLEGGQYSACLQHIERLEKDHPGRACLMATKILLLRSDGHLEEAQRAAADFLARFPESPIALAESAVITAMREGGAAAMPLLQQAIAHCGTQFDRRVYQAMGLICEVLAGEGYVLAARALAMTQVALDHEDDRPVEFLIGYNASPSIPLVLKEEWRLDAAPDGAPWKAEFEQAKSLVGRVQWLGAAGKMAELAERYPEAPAVWRSLAILRAWLADHAGAVEALRKYTALGLPLDDAVAAETLSLMIASDPLGDEIEVLDLEYTLPDPEPVESALLASPRAAALPVDPTALATQDGPPPKGLFFLLDRAVPLTHAALTLESIPRTLGQMLLYGKQTDREARLVVRGVAGPDLASAKQQLQEITEDRLQEPTRQEVGQRMSATRDSLDRHWRLPADTPAERFHELSRQHWEKALLERFPQQALPYLDGQTPQAAAGAEACRAKVLALLNVLKFWIDQSGVEFDVDRVRQRLGLPAPDPIDPQQISVNELPLAHLARVIVEKLSDEDLVSNFQRALAFGARDALEDFARQIAARPSFAGREQRQMALSVLVRQVRAWPEALGFLNQGREEARAAGQSCAAWDLLELPGRLSHLEGQEAVQLIQHLHHQHRGEPGVMNRLSETLMRFGVIRPDGTLAIPTAKAPQPAIVVPGGEPGRQAGKLWTPEGDKPAGQRSALWTPDMG